MLWFLLFAAGLLVATSVNGATEHLPAFLLRLTAVAAVVAAWPKHAVSLRARDVLLPIAALLLLVAGLPWAASFGPALQSVLKVGFVLVIFLGALAAPRRTTALALVAATSVGTFHALWAVGQRLFGAARGTGGFFNPNDLAAFIAPLLVLGLARITTAPAPASARWYAGRRAVAVTTIALAAGLLATGSRSGLLAAVVGAAILAMGHSRRVALLGATLLVVIALLLPGVRGRFLGASDAFAYSRLEIWYQATQVALREPLGVGLGGFEAAMRRQGVPLAGDVRYPKTAHNAHSELLSAWVELGWPGLVLVCLPCGLILIALWRRRRERDTAAQAGVLASLAIPALVSTSLHLPPVAYLAALWAGRLLARDQSAGPELRLTHGRAALGLLGAALLITAVPGVIASTSLTHAAEARDRGDLNAALTSAQRAAWFAPGSAGAAVMVESIRFARGEPALEVAERLVALANLHENRYEPLDRAAFVLERQARATGAPELWTLAAEIRAREVERDPFNALTWVSLGRARHAIGDASGALAAFEHAVELEPRCARALIHLAASAREDGDDERTETLVRAALEARNRAQSYRGYPREVLSLDAISQRILGQLSVNP